MHNFYGHFNIVFMDNIIKPCIFLDFFFISSENVITTYTFILTYCTVVKLRGEVGLFFKSHETRMRDHRTVYTKTLKLRSQKICISNKG